MSENLVIVESPAKAKTINKYLGDTFQVIASYGHIRDLVPKEGAVDTDTFEMRYEPVKKNKKYIDELIKAVKSNKTIYLATDPDREGEAISWHIIELLKGKKLLAKKPVHRVVFHEITKRAVTEAINSPRTLSEELINAQQARRALDYLVGFNLSPLLWKKIRYGLSAGRVQSPALRLIVEREKEIEDFNPIEYWSATAHCEKTGGNPFNANLTRYKSEKTGQFYIKNETQAKEIYNTLIKAANGRLKVANIDKKQRKRSPQPPFITSTLQQDASRKFGFTAQRTMRIAQQLYEGIDIGSGETGLITYMRTDSVHIAQEAIGEIRTFIGSHFGDEMVPSKPNYYKTKARNAQEAHEAIRPTSVNHIPDKIKQHLSDEQFKLYRLIWRRTLACQMVPAKINTVGVDLNCGSEAVFRATGSTISFPGYLTVYQIGVDDPSEQNDEKILPEMEVGEEITLNRIDTEQHFTKPPGRFSEATLIKTLEEFGIGRPSTYATIISTLTSREYVEIDARRFFPTDTGRVVNRFLTDHFTQYVDYEFTANLEDQLDAISRGENQWVPLMKDFWGNFSKQVEEKEKIPRSEVVQARVLGTDPASGKPVSVRMTKYGAAAQIGETEDEEKPRFASLLKGQKLETITLDEALTLFQLPRMLGETESGEEVAANIGRFGPYVRYGKKFVSIKEDDPFTITLERALVLIAEDIEKKSKMFIKEFDDGKVQVLNGRFGPYVKSGRTNAKIPKNVKPEELTLEQCLELIETTKAKKKTKKTTKKK